MSVIDADTHVDECEATWDFIAPEQEYMKPMTVMQEEGGGFRGYHRQWQIDGHMTVRRIRDDVRTGTTVASRELHDVKSRLRHMDAMGVGVHVIYPTVF